MRSAVWPEYEATLYSQPPGAVRPVIDVAVVMPTYNGAKYLKSALDCVARQTMQPAEIIVVDDGSTDGSAELAEACGARVIRSSRAGVCKVRNRGVLEAKACWIAFLDQDDLWLPNKLERQWRAIEQHPDAVLVATDSVKIDADDKLLLPSHVHVDFMRYETTQATSRVNNVDYFADGQAPLEHTGWFLLPSAVLARRDALMSVGIFDERVRLNEDVSCFLRVAMTGALLVVDEALTGWRIHSSNTHHNVLGMHRGRLALTGVALAERELYPIWFLKRLEDEYADLLLEIGRCELHANNMPEAREILLKAMREKPGMKPLLFWLASFLGAKNVERIAAQARRVRRRVP